MKFNLLSALCVAMCFFLSTSVQAQQQNALDLALRHVEQHFHEWNLSKTDIDELAVSSIYQTKHNGATHVYFIQQQNGLDVYNALLSVVVTAEGKVFQTAPRFVAQVDDKIIGLTPEISAESAILAAAQHFDVIAQEVPRQIQAISPTEFVFEGGEISDRNIDVQLVYQPRGEHVVLAWDLAIDLKNGIDYWSVRVDALSGAIIDQINYTVKCTVDHTQFKNHDANCKGHHTVEVPKSITLAQANMLVDDSKYLVFAPPTESPLHGMQVEVENPASVTASPFGWHDTNGMAGPEFTITRGNNTHAYADLNDGDSSTGDEPDGGADLEFLHPYDPDAAMPEDNKDAAVTNLFFNVNYIHDFTHHFGFDEPAGNFQQNNYGNGGAGNDPLIAEAMDGYNTGSLNNAFYSGGADGQAAGIHMFVWDRTAGGGNKLVTVNAPASIAGSYGASTAQFGPPITDVPVTGEVVEATDGVYDPYLTDGCETFSDPATIEGKIAIVDRGGCFFELKTANAEEAGAIALIICNFEDQTIGMAGVPDIDDPGIPAVMLTASDCATIRQFAGQGLNITLKLPEQDGPDFLDGDFDNGIIAHEFAHGISIRLTGGPNANGCLGNGEQMGEGWSDFFTLISTVEAGDTGDMRRGVGTFVTREETNGVGIRRYPYSNDMNTSPLTYGDVAGNPAVHALGEVWCNMLWDMYWAFVDQYGWSADYTDASAGNNIAIQLVMDGMKLQSCGPGFLDGRDAILLADEVNNGGANQCLIWEVFARRGAGFNASQGSADSGTDQVEDFEPLPTCIAELKIDKEVTPFINAGDDIEIRITVTNHKNETLTGVNVTDGLPADASFVAGTISNPEVSASVSGDVITFDLPDMAYLDVVEFTYKVKTSEDAFSIRQYLDEAEDDFNWFQLPITNPTNNPNVWTLTDIEAFSGTRSWYVASVEEESQQVLISAEPFTISGDLPVLRFYHRYDTEPGVDGGVVEVSTDGGVIFQTVADDMLRNGYDGVIQYGTFTIPNFPAFWGDQTEWRATYVDLSEYIGQEVYIRFNFATDENTSPLTSNPGWFVDNIELMDLLAYSTEACVSSDQGDNACAIAEEGGTFVESELTVNTEEPTIPGVQVSVFPNPANDVINLFLESEVSRDFQVSIFTIDGRQVMNMAFNVSGVDSRAIDVSQLPAGFYFVKVNSEQEIAVKKIVIE